MAAAKKAESSPGVRPKVLIIDDSDVDRETMCEILESAGCDVHTLPSPIGATRLARDLGVRLVIIDQNIPAMDGSKLATLFRNNPGLRNVRVVLVSGDEHTSVAGIARDSRADAFVTKRSMFLELPQVVKRLLA